MPRDQFDAKIGLMKPETAQAGAEDFSTAGDVAKSLGSGLARGAAGLAFLPGDIAELGTKGINYAFGTDLKNKVLATSEMALKHLERILVLIFELVRVEVSGLCGHDMRPAPANACGRSGPASGRGFTRQNFGAF